jgi:hypothetical protein
MTATHPSTEHGPDQSETATGSEPAPEPAVSILVSAAGSERCPVCSAEMAADQRYCVECGTRRGKPRFQLAGGQSRPSATTAPQSPSSVPARVTAMLALIVVLVALGVGVLIGNSGGSSPIKGPVTVVLSGSGTTGGTGSAGAKSTGKSAGTSKTPAPSKAPKSFFSNGS